MSEFKLQKAARGKRPQYFHDPAIDRCISMVMALSQEVWVMRERMDSIERLLAAGESVTPEVLDAYRPDEGALADREARREVFLDCVLRSVHQELEAMELGKAPDDIESVVDEVSTT